MPILITSDTFLSPLPDDLKIVPTTLGFINIVSAKIGALFCPFLAHEEYIAIFVRKPSTRVVFHAATSLCSTPHSKFVHISGTTLSSMALFPKRHEL